ncbi:hypothetical protein [Methylobacterium sp. Leaf93]|uniref:hypothetical protein n=1 Tax=Methylobacterium sp. Leaf93 TaxID=1736249 RepID=UPI0006FD8827|nr:hypothetical protein [Methylobacterium sp. Leaf93]KQP08302.1 hypothetical protein ASF26_21540 [Methylobacterium sp. Leaf93]
MSVPLKPAVTMSDGDETAAVADDSVDVEPRLDHAQTPLTTEMASDAAPSCLVEGQTFGCAAASS